MKKGAIIGSVIGVVVVASLILTRKKWMPLLKKKDK